MNYFTLDFRLKEFGLADPKISFCFNMPKLILSVFRNYNWNDLPPEIEIPLLPFLSCASIVLGSSLLNWLTLQWYKMLPNKFLFADLWKAADGANGITQKKNSTYSVQGPGRRYFWIGVRKVLLFQSQPCCLKNSVLHKLRSEAILDVRFPYSPSSSKILKQLPIKIFLRENVYYFISFLLLL